MHIKNQRPVSEPVAQSAYARTTREHAWTSSATRKAGRQQNRKSYFGNTYRLLYRGGNRSLAAAAGYNLFSFA
jgi:hypothetical protein